MLQICYNNIVINITSCLSDIYGEKGDYIMTNFKYVFSNYDLCVILESVFQRRLEAKQQMEKIEEGRKETSYYPYWQKIYNDCDKVYMKLLEAFMKED